jgi:hypothetical protein
MVIIVNLYLGFRKMKQPLGLAAVAKTFGKPAGQP